MMTALAIGIHNFPEGLATFVATLDDPAVGASLAIAIAIHNIPEGLCVSIPIYFATGDRWKAFRWALLSGVSAEFLPTGAVTAIFGSPLLLFLLPRLRGSRTSRHTPSHHSTCVEIRPPVTP